MKKIPKFLLLVVMLVAACMLLMACGVFPDAEDQPSDTQDPATQDQGEEKVLRFSIVSEPGTMDPHDGSSTTESYGRAGIYEGLAVWKNGELCPGVAESWDISDDGLVYTFHLRNNATWWDGQPVTAQNFVDGYTRLIDPNGPNGDYAFYGYMVVNGEAYHTGAITDESQVGVKALDEYTFEVTLNKPVPYFLSLQAAGFFYPIRQDVADEYGREYGTGADKVMGNGPFILDSWAHESEMILVKNENYWDAGSINLDRVEIYIVADANTALNMFEAGELDYVFIPSEYVSKYEAEGKALYFENGVEWWMEFNMDSQSAAAPFLANANFRKAIGYALDRQSYVDAVYNNGSTPALCYTPGMMNINGKLWSDVCGVEWYEPAANLEKAEEYLQKALAELGMTKDQIPAIGFLTDDTAERKLSAEAIQDMLYNNLGINLEITLVQSKNRYEMMKDGDFDIVWAGYSPDYNDPNSWLERLQSTSGLNDTRFADPEFDSLIAAAAKETDGAARADLLVQAEKIMQDRGPLVPVYMKASAWTKADYLEGMVFGVISDLEGNYIYADIVK